MRFDDRQSPRLAAQKRRLLGLMATFQKALEQLRLLAGFRQKLVLAAKAEERAQLDGQQSRRINRLELPDQRGWAGPAQELVALVPKDPTFLFERERGARISGRLFR